MAKLVEFDPSLITWVVSESDGQSSAMNPVLGTVILPADDDPVGVGVLAGPPPAVTVIVIVAVGDVDCPRPSLNKAWLQTGVGG
jgi:hypothetical protein